MKNLEQVAQKQWRTDMQTDRLSELEARARLSSHVQGARISANSDFRYFAISEAAPGVNFRQCLGRDPKINSEGAGGLRPPAPSEVIFGSRPRHCRKLTPSAASKWQNT